MKKTALPSPHREQQNGGRSSSRVPNGAPVSSQSHGDLAQLAGVANQSPRVQAQLKLANEMSGSPQITAQRNLAAEINSGAATAQLKRLDEKPAQTKGRLDEKKLAQTKPKELEKPRQHKLDDTGPAQLEAAPNRTGLPDHLKAGVESLSGVSLDSVQVHYNSPKPAQLNALAYTQGTDIHVAPGQEKHLPHEAWHITQQSQGRVKPTTKAKGVAINDDSRLEKEADMMGAKAATVQAKADIAQAVGKKRKK